MTRAPGAGIPTRDAYQDVVQSPLFRTLEEYSDRFQARHRALLQPYARRWVIDPLHQWSRQWEYPFMWAALQALAGAAPLSVLDAGAGLTFFPHFLLERHAGLQVECCDLDPTLPALYEAVARQQPRAPRFRVADLTQLPYADASFDVIYCISVLEHIPARERVMSEFFRVLKPGGRLLLSFDLSLDGSRDIGLDEARRMVAELDRYFEGTAALAVPAAGGLEPSAVFTTDDARRLSPALLPWPYPAAVYRLRALLQGKGWVRWPPLLTVSCGALVRRPAAG